MSNTEHRNYPKPVPAHNVSDDVLLLQQAMDLVDNDIHLLFAAIADLAPIDHEHVIADIQGLTTALAGKSDTTHTHTLEALSDVGGTLVAPAGYVLVKLVDGTWGPASPASIIGSHQHVIEDVVNLQTALDGLGISAQVAAVAQTTVLDADEFAIRKSSTGALIKQSWANIKTAIWAALGPAIVGQTAKNTPLDGDVFVVADSAASNATRKVGMLNLWSNYLKGKADAVYLAIANVATAAQYRAKAADKVLTADKVFGAAAPVDLGSLSGSVTLDFAAFFHAYGTLAANITFSAASNLAPGQTGVIVLTNPGAFTLGVNTATFIANNGAGIQLASGKNDISYYVDHDLKVHIFLVGKGMA